MSDGNLEVEVRKPKSRVNEGQANPTAKLPEVDKIENYADVVKGHQEQRRIDKEEKRAERKEQKSRAKHKNETPVPTEGDSELTLQSSAQVVLPLPQSLLQPIPFKNIEQSGLNQHRVLPEQWATINTKDNALKLVAFLNSNKVIPPNTSTELLTITNNNQTIYGLRFINHSGSDQSKAFFMYCNSLAVCPFAVYNDPNFKDFRKMPPLYTSDLVNTGSSVASSPLSNFNARKVFNYYHLNTDSVTKDLGVRKTDWIVPDKYFITRQNAVLIDNKVKAQEAANVLSLMHNHLIPIHVEITISR